MLVCLGFLVVMLSTLIQGLPIGRNMIDLSYSYDDNVVYFPGYEPFKLETIFKGNTSLGVWITAGKFCGPEHGGTHMDAPYHFNPNGWKLDEIPFERFVAPAVVVNISSKALTDPNAALEVEDLIAWEDEYGTIPNGSVVIVNSGHGVNWGNTTAFLGLKEASNTTETEASNTTVTDLSKAGTKEMNYPGIGEEAAKFLVANRSIVGVGVDTVSYDPGNKILFPAHQIIHGANLYGLENLANLDKLPPSGATLFMLPMKIKGASGAPTRVLAKF